MPRVRVAACQINTVVGDLEGNAGRILDALAEAEEGGADLAVFPELTVTGYPPEDLLSRPACGSRHSSTSWPHWARRSASLPTMESCSRRPSWTSPLGAS